MSELVVDLVEDILKRLDVRDLIRCKKVCKSWLSLISCSSFVQTHLKYTCKKDNNDHELAHRRIIMSFHRKLPHDRVYTLNLCQIIGSSNGLVCVSPVDAQVLVTNPSTREVKHLNPPPKFPNISMDREFLCWGFGHDSFMDDYKVVMGIKMGKAGTLFQVLSLKLNSWKIVSQVKYKKTSSRFGILWNGALHWFMKDINNRQIVLLSFDLSREEFREIPQPDDSRYVCDYYNCVGMIDKCLCTYRNNQPYQRWVMKNYNDKDSWELLPYDFEMNKNDVAHTLKHNSPHTLKEDSIPFDSWCLCEDESICFSRTADYIRAHIFVKSLVSPHVYGKPKKTTRPKINKRSAKRVSSYDVLSRSLRFSHNILKRRRLANNRKMNGNGISSGFRIKYPA